MRCVRGSTRLMKNEVNHKEFNIKWIDEVMTTLKDAKTDIHDHPKTGLPLWRLEHTKSHKLVM